MNNNLKLAIGISLLIASLFASAYVGFYLGVYNSIPNWLPLTMAVIGSYLTTDVVFINPKSYTR